MVDTSLTHCVGAAERCSGTISGAGAVGSAEITIG